MRIFRPTVLFRKVGAQGLVVVHAPEICLNQRFSSIADPYYQRQSLH